MAGILYLCATPIGNLEDMTPRAQRMLAEADIIAAEDTRHTLQLLNRFNIKGRLVRYDEPVSYTHLDVYKRQECRCADGRGPCPG